MALSNNNNNKTNTTKDNLNEKPYLGIPPPPPISRIIKTIKKFLSIAMCAQPTFHFKIIPFPTLQDGMREAEPGSFFAQLWNDVMDDEAQ